MNFAEREFEKHVWAQIDLDALRANWRTVAARAGGMPLCAVVKADAYGHGAVECARALAAEGARWFAVSNLREALQLRQTVLWDTDRYQVLVLGYTDPAQAPALLQWDITQACHSKEYAVALNEAAANPHGFLLPIHLKLDTGMGRIGYPLRTDYQQAMFDIAYTLCLPNLQATGVFQHFAAADETTADSRAYTAQQHALFCRAVADCLPGFDEPENAVVHCDNSAGVMLHPDWPAVSVPPAEGAPAAPLPRSQCMARPGIVLYGFDPSSQVRFGAFRPVMQLKTVVSQVKTLAPGQSAGYGRKFTAAQPTRVATLCAGYADGYPRLLSCGKGLVELHGTACPVVGSVCMDQMMVDVSALPEGAVRPGDEAILWGGTAGDSVETVAEKTGTICYEVLCGVSRRVPRVYVQGGRVVKTDDFLLG